MSGFWYCPNDGHITVAQVTWSERCAECGEKVEWVEDVNEQDYSSSATEQEVVGLGLVVKETEEQDREDHGQ